MTRNNTYYLCRIPEKYQDYQEDEYYFLVDLDWNVQEIKFKDTCGRMVPVSFEHLCELRDTLSKVISHIAMTTVGADYEVSKVSN